MQQSKSNKSKGLYVVYVYTYIHTSMYVYILTFVCASKVLIIFISNK